jgi:hypothetical protein
MRTVTLLAAPEPFSPDELATIRRFLVTRGYDPIVMPGLRSEELNRFNRIPVDEYHSLYSSLLADPAETLAGYDFSLRPATDDRPFFFHFFRWRQTPGVVARLGQAWQPFGGSGYLVLLALAALMLILTIPFVFLPLALLRLRRLPLPPAPRSRLLRPLFFFASLGAGYLLVEVPLIQRLTLLLDRPILGMAAVLFALLLASGLGSLLSPRIALRPALVGLVACIALTALVLPPVVRAALPLSLFFRLAVALGLLVPTGFLMGVPFAAGLGRLERERPGLIPWAWAVNGAVSGLSGVLAALVTLDGGQTAALGLAAAAYAIAFASVDAGRKPSSSGTALVSEGTITG